MNFAILICILISIFSHLVSADYSYKNPDEWVKMNPTCGGSKQSPIDLGESVSKILDVDCPTAVFSHYFDKPNSLVITNDGHALKIEGTWPKCPTVKLNNELINCSYRLHQIRLHWGRNENNCTEHLVFGAGGSIETHAIHLNDKYEEDDEALAAKDGVLILAHGLGKTELKDEIGDLDVLHEGVAKVREIGSSAKLPQFTLDEMGIKNAQVFFVYEGSLSYPPCTENVIWLYSANGGIVTKSTMETLRKTKLLNGDTNNIRPVQKLGDRVVTSLSCV